MWFSNFFLCIQLFPAFFIVQNYQGPGFSGPKILWVQVFQGPGFSESRFLRVRVQGLGPCFGSSRLSLVLTINFCYLQLIFFCILFKKDTKINKQKKRRNILKKMNSLKKGEGVPLLNFEGGPGVPLLNFRGVPGPTFKLWGGSRVPGTRVPRSWSHFYTMPIKSSQQICNFSTWVIFEKQRYCSPL